MDDDGSNNGNRSTASFNIFGVEFSGPTHLAVILLIGVLCFAALWYYPDLSARFRPAGFSGEIPRLLNPANGSSFSHFPRGLNLIWEPVPEAVSYVIEIEAQDLRHGDWFPQPGYGRIPTTETEITGEFIGAQPGRWRVTAIDAKGTRSRASEW